MRLNESTFFLFVSVIKINNHQRLRTLKQQKLKIQLIQLNQLNFIQQMN